MIEFRNFGFKYDAQSEPTLHDINLTIGNGEKVLICGPSGCGKSTLAHCINGLIPASRHGTVTGELTVDGKSYKDLDIFKLSKTVGTVLQDSDAQFIGLTVGEDIAFALENDTMDVEEMRKKVRETAEIVGVTSHLNHAPHELSGGLKQRVSLAGVMVDNVSVLLFDEPLANLDPAAGKATIELIDSIQKETGCTVIIIEHRLEDVLHRHVDRIVLMNDGRIVSDTNTADLLCSDRLREVGIREPLYITALKYAGVRIRPEIHPEHIDLLDLPKEDIEKVRSWYNAVKIPRPEQEQPAVLDVVNLSMHYDDWRNNVLNDVSLCINRGEMLAIVGKNGAGKSTFAKVLCGFEKHQKGTVYMEGTDLDILSIKERAQHIGYVMQNPNQMIVKTMIREEVGLGLELQGKLSKEEIGRRVDKALKICGLYQFRSWPISALSYGQKKRVTIASILCMDPKIIILDEPTAGQDFRHYTEIMEFLEELNKQGITIILITHDMHLMIEYCTRAVVFSDTRMIGDESCEDVLSDDKLVKEASLKKTSLSTLASICSIEDESQFIKHFIIADRQVRK